ncbi:HAD family hydrolase [Aureibacter tunicatorum]|uniref:Hydrolase of the HAD superfamily n=1 Tax=Aureibacter tunicatorum TaxID=866807 RepID=A0AAE4BSS9_9BACT|nr:HAD family hydrolase [Aureibacter tunicatorum]MDR6239143.1 putative hydrolase of the HAD superfamily [Aureibacter tunicatorum]BDD04931.1 haloacid dehalogenase [Aureibacter tunicatorum]
MKNIEIIAFDADDTLWVNEPYFRETEQKFCVLLQDYLTHHSISQELFKTEIDNLPLYGYGVKGFMLSMIETISKVTDNQASLDIVSKTLELGKELLEKPIELLDGVEDTLAHLKGKYRLVLATKGDLLDQERKLVKSGLENYFHHIEVMSNKEKLDYKKMLNHLDCQAENFLMVGNSLKSDVLPVLDLGGHAIHVPYHTTWAHEVVDKEVKRPNFAKVDSIRDVLGYLA